MIDYRLNPPASGVSLEGKIFRPMENAVNHLVKQGFEENDAREYISTLPTEAEACGGG